MNTRNGFFAALVAVTCAGTVLAASNAPVSGAKKGILVVSFGTSYEVALKANIEATERRIAEAFPDYEVRRAFTSSIIIKILKKRGVSVDPVGPALEKMAADGFTEVVVQPLHLIPGEEYDELRGAVDPHRSSFSRLIVGTPLFYDTESYFTAIRAIEPNLPESKPGEAVVLMGHGTRHPANSSYSLVQRIFEEENLPVYVGTVEGYPSIEQVIPRLKRDGVKTVALLPLMLVAGDHANNDMAGDEKDSWKSLFEADGFAVKTVIRGLGELPSIQDVYVQKIRAAIAELDSPAKENS